MEVVYISTSTPVVKQTDQGSRQLFSINYVFSIVLYRIVSCLGLLTIMCITHNVIAYRVHKPNIIQVYSQRRNKLTFIALPITFIICYEVTAVFCDLQENKECCPQCNVTTLQSDLRRIFI